MGRILGYYDLTDVARVDFDDQNDEQKEILSPEEIAKEAAKEREMQELERLSVHRAEMKREMARQGEIEREKKVKKAEEKAKRKVNHLQLKIKISLARKQKSWQLREI